MERVYFADHRGTPVLHVDYSGLHDPEDLFGVVRKASALVRTHPPGSLLVLVDLTDVPFGLATTAIMQQGVAESRPHVKARAVVGLLPEAEASFERAAKLFGKPMARFTEPMAAKDWLLGQSGLAPALE
jgi:hypothetical protein